MIEIDSTKCRRCGFLAKRKIERFLEIPDEHSIYGAIMVGYPKHEYRKIPPRKERPVRWI